MDSRFNSKIMLLEEIQVTTETSGETSIEKSAPASAVEAVPLSNEQLRFVAEHASCAMCDSELETRHQVNLAELRLREEAHCPSCGIRVRSSQHLLH